MCTKQEKHTFLQMFTAVAGALNHLFLKQHLSKNTYQADQESKNITLQQLQLLMNQNITD